MLKSLEQVEKELVRKKYGLNPNGWQNTQEGYRLFYKNGVWKIHTFGSRFVNLKNNFNYFSKIVESIEGTTKKHALKQFNGFLQSIGEKEVDEKVTKISDCFKASDFVFATCYSVGNYKPRFLLEKVIMGSNSTFWRWKKTTLLPNNLQILAFRSVMEQTYTQTRKALIKETLKTVESFKMAEYFPELLI